MKKKIILVAIEFVLLVATLLVLGILYTRNGIAFAYNGFAVDENERVYVGKSASFISVFENGEKIGQFRITNRGYSFTIVDGNTMMCLESATMLYLDLNILLENLPKYSTGYLSEQDICVIKTENMNEQPQKIVNYFWAKYTHNRTFTSSTGINYQLKRHFGKTSIEREDGKVLLESGMGETVLIVILCILGLLFIATVYCSLAFFLPKRIARGMTKGS